LPRRTRIAKASLSPCSCKSSNGFTINPNLAAETACQLVERLQGRPASPGSAGSQVCFPSGVAATPRGSSPIGTVATVSITETLLSTSFAMRSKVHARVEHVVWSDHRCPRGMRKLRTARTAEDCYPSETREAATAEDQQAPRAVRKLRAALGCVPHSPINTKRVMNMKTVATIVLAVTPVHAKPITELAQVHS